MPSKLTGTYILVAGGTGILPYLDFSFYVLRYMISKVSKNNYNENLNKIDKNEFFSEIGDGFKVILFVSYSTRNSAFMHDILLKANGINKKYNMNLFDYYMRTNDDLKWDRAFFNETLKYVQKEGNQLHLCGPVGFMELMKNNFMETGKISVNNIFYT